MNTPLTSANDTSPEQIEDDIARQRDDLAETVNQLHATLDVRSRLTTASGRPRPDLVAAAGVVLLATGMLVWRRRH